jgi:hypothetical protein
MEGVTVGFRVVLNSEAHSNRDDYFHNKEALTAFILDTIQTLPNGCHFELHIIREGQVHN